LTYSEKSEEDRAEYLEKIEKLPLVERIDVDESGVESCLVREYGRAVRGVKIEDIKRGRKFHRTNVVAAQFKSEDGKIKVIEPFCYSQNMRGEFFEDWFKRRLVKSVPNGVTIIMDNASFHRKKKLRNLARRHGVKLLFLPTYSPDFNPIEHTWSNRKRALVDILPDSETLEKGIYDYFKSNYF
jgi:transposase